MRAFRVLVFVTFSLVACRIAYCEQAAVLFDNMEAPGLYMPYHPELGAVVSLDTEDFKEGRGCLRFDIKSPQTGKYYWPTWIRDLDPDTNDWTGYKALRYWVKVVSEDPKVTSKVMFIWVTSGSNLSQQLVKHRVPVGEWVQLTDDMTNYDRGRVENISLYLVPEGSHDDDYTWWVDGLELVPIEGTPPNFDQLSVEAINRPRQEPLYQVVAQDGLALVLDNTGRVVQLRSPKGPMSPDGDEVSTLSGLMIRDWRTDKQPRPVEGSIVRHDWGLRQSQAFEDGLLVTAFYKPQGDRIQCNVTVKDTGDDDRPLTLYFVLPVDATGWTWWNDIRTPRPITGTGELFYQPMKPKKPRWSAYPFCCISGDTEALGLATPLDMPRLQRMVYNPRFQCLYIAYDFCLSPAAVKQHQTAEFAFRIFRSDPEWGLRSTVQKYYDYFPDYFVKRIPRDGGWVCWGNLEGNQHIPDLGLLYHWGLRPPAAKFDNEHGYFAFNYIEWTNMHTSMEGYEQAGPKEIMERLRYIADPDRGEPLPRYAYSLFFSEELYGTDYQGWMPEMAKVLLRSLVLDRSGNLYGQARPRDSDYLMASYIPCNADPDIPGGLGEFHLNTTWPLIDTFFADGEARYDGFAWDNFQSRGDHFNYRREHFAYTDEPLWFDPDTLEPFIIKDMSTYELEQEIAARLRSQSRYLIANLGGMSTVPAMLPLVDIFGYEGGIRGTETYARTMGHHKPVCSLPTRAEHYQDPFVRDHLLYGCWPGGYYNTANSDYVALMETYVPILERLSAAGWEPVTLAWTDDEQVQIERFGGTRLREGYGGQGGKELFFSFKNHSKEDKSVRVTVDKSLLDPQDGPYAATELVSGEACRDVTSNGKVAFAVDIPGGTVVAVAVEAAD